MLNEQIIEFQLRGLGSWSYMHSYNWLFSWQNKKSLEQIFEWIIIYC